MFWNKKKAQNLANESAQSAVPQPVWVKNEAGELCGVKTLHGEFTIKTYAGLMMSAPGSKIMYMYNHRGDKVAWDIRSDEELMEVVNSYMQPPRNQ